LVHAVWWAAEKLTMPRVVVDLVIGFEVTVLHSPYDHSFGFDMDHLLTPGRFSQQSARTTLDRS